MPITIDCLSGFRFFIALGLAGALGGFPSDAAARKKQAKPGPASAETLRGAAIRVNAGNVLHRVTPRMIGVNIEDLNYQCYGGLYSQLIYGDTFQEHVDSAILGLSGKDRLQVFIEENGQGGVEVRGFGGNRWNHNVARKILGLPQGDEHTPVSPAELAPKMREPLLASANGSEQVSRHWRKRQTGSAKGALQFERRGPFVGRWSQRVTFLSGEGEFGIENAGLNRWGVNFIAGKPYEGLLRIKAEQECEVCVCLLGADGERKLAEKSIGLKAAPGEYQRIEFTLTPSGSDEHGRFGISLKQPGSIVVGYAFLQAGEWGRFKGLPLRKELVEAVIGQGVTVMRYDGSMVNKCPDGRLYKWKEMIGPRNERKPYHGTFNPYATNEFGIFEILNLCEAAGFLPVPGIRTDETAEDVADFVEYVNGPADSPWGKRRAADGHLGPYNLKHIEIGNEERFDEHYCERFETLGASIWSRDPEITLLIANNLGRPSTWAIGPDGAVSEELKLAVRLVEFAKKRGGTIWWDCHYRADELRAAESPEGRIAAMGNLKQSISKLVPGYNLQIAALEENGPAHNMGRALAHAHNHNTFARMGDWLPAIAVANTLQADGQEIVWSQGKTFFTSSKVWFQPPYYIDQMISRNWASNVVEVDCTSPNNALDALAKTTDDGKALVIQVVNLEPAAVETTIAVRGFSPSRPTIAVTQIAGDLELENTLEEPEKIKPSRAEWEREPGSAEMTCAFPAYSFTILRFE